MGKLKNYYIEKGYFDYPYKFKEEFNRDDESYDEYRYNQQLREAGDI